MESALVSIIVPIYNVEDYLETCVESLVNQTYRNIEIILVDDGSTDKSKLICDSYLTKDPRIVVIHKENGGLSDARKVGISAMHGQYAMFVDGDDWIDPNTIEVCMEQMIQNAPLDCVLFSYVKELPDRSIPAHVMNESAIFRGEDAEERVYRRFFGLSGEELAHPERMENIVSCCMKLYCADVARCGQYYDTQVVGSSEDALFNIHALYGCNNIAYLDECFYHYRKRPASLTSTYRPKLPEQWNTLFDIMQNFISERQLDEEYQEALENRIALSSVGIGLNIVNNRGQGSAWVINAIDNYLKSSRYHKACKKINLSKMPLKWRIFMLCCRFRLSVLVYLLLKAMSVLRRVKRSNR